MAHRYQMLLLLLAFLVLCLESCRAGPVDEQFGLMKRSPRRYCGKRLADTLLMICRGMYKRNGLELSHDDAQDDTESNSVDLDESYNLFRHHYLPAAGHANLFHRVSRGIIDDCCMQACDLSTLMAYCS